MKKELDVISLLESLRDDRVESENLKMSHLDSEAVHGTRGSFVATLIEEANLYIKDPTKSTAFHAASFYGFREPFLQKLFGTFE